ncbi:hypothetical protein M501DRAFT_929664 [Patellaria atrata CBS 101060]|uniref:rRNA-processing protein EFG1 n=1 Tax=Patellaria atrata CBS 101060 TaxID=1346257 RepID=A0A9P4VV00_9PEZI|nr:hypothetical protein M501DRAFT_929664 [Patellaria atrata CBS 101060]
MTLKRKIEGHSTRPNSSVHPSRKAQIKGFTEAPQRKKRKPNPFEGGVSRPKKHTIGPINKRIRDLRRQLENRDDLPADLRVARERELVACERDLVVTKAEIQKQEMIGKYHMVRFFDRKKATRHLRHVKKQLDEASDPSDIDNLRLCVHIAEVDLNYTQYYPLAQAYSALYPSSGRDRSDDNRDKRDVDTQKHGNREMWKAVEQAMKEGTLNKLRNSLPVEEYASRESMPKGLNGPTPHRDENAAHLEIEASDQNPTLDVHVMKKQFGPSKRREGRGQPVRSVDDGVLEEDESDGGFFE